MKNTFGLKAKALFYLKECYPNWVHKGELGRLAVTEWGFENENLGRRCRELENQKLIEVDYVKAESGAKCAVYRYIPKSPTSDTEKELERQKLLLFSQG